MKKNIPFLIGSLLITALIITRCNNKLPESAPAIKYATAPPVGANQKLVTIPPSKDTSYVVITATTNTTTSINAVVTTSPTVPPITPPDTTTGYVRKNLIYNTTFDGANPFSEWHNTQHCCTYSIVQDFTRTRYGAGSMKVTLNKTDATVAASKRSEINENNSEPVNAERWIGVSYYFPAAYASDKDAELVMQFHTDAPAGSPPFEIDIVSDRFQFVQAINPNAGQTTSGKDFKRTDIGAVSKEKWIDMVWHYKQSSGSDGLVEGWINGVKVYNQTGPNTFAAYANYMKIGINKWTWMPNSSYGGNQTQRIFNIDQLRVGNEKATYTDVDPSKP